MKTSQVLINAKELLISKGWIQDGNHKTSKGYDLTGALSYGTPDNDAHVRTPFWDALEIVAELLQPGVEHASFFFISDYNNKKGRKKEDILKLLDQAIVIAVEKELTLEPVQDIIAK